MKKLFAIAMALMVMVAMAACAPSAGPADDDKSPAVKAPALNADGKYTVGVCQLTPHEALDAATQGFVDTLKAELGEDKVEIDVQVAAGDTATCSPIINGFVSNADMDLIMANATPALQAAVAATSEIPILGTSVTEYGVALDIQNFSGTVGGNVSGTSDLADLKKQADMVTEWFPEAKTVSLLYCSGEANSQYQVDTVKAALEAKGVTCKLYSFADSNDLQSVAQEAVNNGDVLYIPTDNTCAAATGTIDAVCSATSTPVIAGEEGICRGCGVATLSISYYDLGCTTGKMAAQILKGEADISTMPIAYAEKLTPKYNAAICERLSIKPLDGYVPVD